MWIPADWMVWTYIGIVACLTVASIALAVAEDKLDAFRLTDLLGTLAAVAILYDWLNKGASRPALVILLLLVIYTLANAEALMRSMRSETFATDEDRDGTFVFSAVFTMVLSLPLYYLGSLLLTLE